ncbi:MAG: YVTN family beta-propeller repeat-containing protein [Prevotella sp.]|jgi:YVTN family beta-propeller protein|nr:YVTN family beta-propeller repeat-containing protein [Prevotella sp.]
MKKVKYVLINEIIICFAIFLISAKYKYSNSPFFTTNIVINEVGELFMVQKGTMQIDKYLPDGKTLIKSYSLSEAPTGITVNENKAYITTFGSWGHLQILDLERGNIETTIPTGSGTTFPLLSPDKQYIYVANQFSNTVSEINLATNKIERTVGVLREPKEMIFSRDGKYLFVTNYLPAQRADLDYVASCVSVIDIKSFKKIKDIQLANGSNALRGICITPDGKYIYVTHNLGRYTVPTSQLQQGWMNTSAFSIIEVDKQEFLGAVLVDEPERGAAGVWGISCDNDQIYIAHSGTHDISIIDHKKMLEKFLAYPDKEKLDYDLTFLYGIRTRIPIEGNGPRAIALFSNQLIIPTYFSDILNFVDTDSYEVNHININPNRVETRENLGEKYFNDAAKCFQNWQSCNGCHPGDGRMDGMNWDLMNDGIGNPKNCKSLLFSHVTPKCMISGIRDSAEIAVRAGYKHIQFYDIDEESAACVDDYLKSLRPVPSPYLINGELSEKAKEGKKVFEKLDCGACHSGPYYTDLKMHRIGNDIEFEAGWDTPTLKEVWRTAPYLFDGRAGTMKEVFSVHKHGIKDKKVSNKEIEALSEYVNSL